MEEVDISNGCVDITDDLWQRILRLYLRTYRGPNAESDLKRELVGYKVLIRDATVDPGRYVRYLPRGIVDSELRRGGWVVKCNTKSIHLQDGRRQWRVSRLDNYIFVRDAADDQTGLIRNNKPSLLRLLAEEAIRKDDTVRSLPRSLPPRTSVPPVTPRTPVVAESPPRIKIVARFKE